MINKKSNKKNNKNASISVAVFIIIIIIILLILLLHNCNDVLNTIEFNSNGGTSISPIIAEKGVNIRRPIDPVLEGYTFGGWYIDEGLTEDYVISVMPEENITLYAKWFINQYTITFDSNEGSEVSPISALYGAAIIAPATPSLIGNTFNGWYSDEELTIIYQFTTMPATDITLYAKWTINESTISFAENGGSGVPDITGNYGIAINSPAAPTLLGNIFGGWYSDEEFASSYEFTLMPAANITLYAKWTIIEYTISFEENGGSEVANISEDYGTAVNAPAFPTLTGYNFNGWYSDITLTNSYVFTIMPAENITLYAKWTINQYTISFEENGGSAVSDLNGDYGTSVNAPIIPTLTGNTFNGWYSNIALTNAYVFTTMPAENITVYAKWTINQYTMSFEENGGSHVSNMLVDFGTNLNAPLAPTLTGYTFSGWYSDIALTIQYVFTTMPSSNIRLYAKWTINQYTISFDENGGSEVTDITEDYGAAVIAPVAPTLDYYTFGGWFTDELLNTAFVFTTMPADNITIYAKWIINQYTISFDENEGSPIANITADYDTVIVAPAPPTLDGNSFSGWYSDIALSTPYVFTTMPADNITIYAKWTVNEYTIDFIENGGSIVNSISADFGDAIFTPVEPTKDGCLFVDWYEDIDLITVFTFTTMPSHNVTLYAKWDYYFEYSIADDKVTITGYKLTMPNNPIIPALVDGMPVTEIGDGAFSDSSLTSISLPTGLDTIGDNAFYMCQHLSSINIPDTVTSIGEHAMQYCFDLTSIDIPDSVISIGAYTFFNCSSLTTVTLSANLASLSDYLFENCYLLDNLIIPNSVTSIGKETFGFCTFSDIIISDSVTSIDNKAFYYCTGITSIIIPDSVTFLGTEIFYSCTELQSAELPEDITIIPSYMFGECTNLTNIDIPDSVITIDDNAFYRSGLAGEVILPDDLITLGDFAFARCASITKIVIPDSVVTIGDGVFSQDSMLSDVTLPSGITIITESMFHSCGSLHSISLPLSVTVLGPACFTGSGLTDFTFHEGITTISDWAFYLCTTLPQDIILPSTLTYIGYNTFNETSVLRASVLALEPPTLGSTPFHTNFIGFYVYRSVMAEYKSEWPSFVNKIFGLPFNVDFEANGGEAVDSISDVTEGTILPDTTMAGYTFSGWYIDIALTIPYDVALVDEDSITLYAAWTINQYTMSFDSGNGEAVDPIIADYNSVIVTPDEPLYDGHDFDDWYEDSDCTIPYVFTTMPSSNITVYVGWICYLTYDFTDGNEDEIIITGYVDGLAPFDVRIPSLINDLPVVSIADNSFSDFYDFETHTGLTSMFIPDSVTSIGESAFAYCLNLTSITLSENLQNIPDMMLLYCFNLLSIDIPNSVLSIGDMAFYGCQFSEIEIPLSVLSIGDAAFMYCDKITEMDIPNSILTIGISAFESCTELVTIHLPESLDVISASLFKLCSSIETIDLPLTLTAIGDYSFSQCESLLSIDIPDLVTIIGEYAFERCILLEEVEFSDNLDIISDLAFSNCTSLDNITLPDGLSEILYAAFFNCDSLTSITLPDSITSLGNQTFDSCDTLATAILPSAITSIDYLPDMMFRDCPLLNNVTIPSNIITLEDSVFLNCVGLSDITISEGVEVLGNYVFSSCLTLDNVTIPSTVTTFGDGLFQWCQGLSSFVIPNTVTNIGESTFFDCINLSSITLPDNLSFTEIPFGMFSWCTSLTHIDLPSNITVIGTSAFSASGLTEIDLSNIIIIGTSAFSSCKMITVEIPVNVTSIGDYAFGQFDPITITDITVYANVPPTIDGNPFSGTNCNIYVKKTLVDDYQSDWAVVTERIKGFINVTFETNGGDPIDPQIANETTVLPNAVMGATAFLGWYFDDTTFLVPYDYASILTDIATVYAKWSV